MPFQDNVFLNHLGADSVVKDWEFEIKRFAPSVVSGSSPVVILVS